MPHTCTVQECKCNHQEITNKTSIHQLLYQRQIQMQTRLQQLLQCLRAKCSDAHKCQRLKPSTKQPTAKCLMLQGSKAQIHQMLKCTNAQLHQMLNCTKCSNAQMLQGSNVLRYTNGQMPNPRMHKRSSAQMLKIHKCSSPPPHHDHTRTTSLTQQSRLP